MRNPPKLLLYGHNGSITVNSRLLRLMRINTGDCASLGIIENGDGVVCVFKTDNRAISKPIHWYKSPPYARIFDSSFVQYIKDRYAIQGNKIQIILNQEPELIGKHTAYLVQSVLRVSSVTTKTISYASTDN